MTPWSPVSLCCCLTGGFCGSVTGNWWLSVTSLELVILCEWLCGRSVLVAVWLWTGGSWLAGNWWLSMIGRRGLVAVSSKIIGSSWITFVFGFMFSAGIARTLWFCQLRILVFLDSDSGFFFSTVSVRLTDYGTAGVVVLSRWFIGSKTCCSWAFDALVFCFKGLLFWRWMTRYLLKRVIIWLGLRWCFF